jgi:hypothetical protein
MSKAGVVGKFFVRSLAVVALASWCDRVLGGGADRDRHHDGRKWADMRYIAPRDNSKNPRDGLLHTRILATSYEGQLLEILFTSNTDENPALKDKIDQVLDSVRLAK